MKATRVSVQEQCGRVEGLSHKRPARPLLKLLREQVPLEVVEIPTGTPVYDVPMFLWDEPETVTHDPPFRVPDGGGFKLTCDWNNLSDEPVGFGTGVDDEMCFIWAYYFPSRGALVCANGLLGCD